MLKAAGAALEPTRRTHPVKVCLILAVSLLMTVSLTLFGETIGWHFVLAGALFFFGTAVLVLMRNIVRKMIYAIFLLQMTASYLMQASLMVTIAGVLLFVPILLVSEGTGRISSIPCRTPLTLMLLGWLSSIFYVTIFGYSSRGYTMLYDVHLLLGFGLVYMIFCLIQLKHLDVDRLLFCVSLSGLVLVGLTVAKYITNGHAALMFAGRFGMSVNINPNLLAMYVGLTFPPSIFIALHEKRSVTKKALMYAVSVVYAAVFFMTASRGSLFGLSAVALYIIWSKRSASIFAGALTAAVIAYFTVGKNMIVRIFNPTSNDILSNFGRVELLRSAFDILKDNYYMLGIGMNNFAAHKLDYGFPFFFDRNGTLSSHNLYVEMWLGWGILGLIGWVLFNGWIIYALFCSSRNEKYRCASQGIAFAMIAYMLHGLVDSCIAGFSIMFTYFTLVGIALYIVTRKNQDAALTNASQSLSGQR